MAILPLFILGRSVPQGHVYGLILFSILGASLLLPNLWLKLIGLMISAWLGYSVMIAFVKPYPLTPFVNVSIIIFLGMVFFLFIFYSALPLDFCFGAICVSALAQAALGICQKLWFDPVSTIISKVVVTTGALDFSTPTGTLANPNFLGAYLAISIPFFFRRRWIGFVPVVAFGLCITNASAACGAAIIGIGYFLWGWKGCLKAILPGLVYITMIGDSLDHLLADDRYSLWIDAIEKVRLSVPSFFFGYGQGTAWRPDNLLHSEYVMTLFSFGGIGLVCMAAYIVTIYRGQRHLFTAFLILCVNMAANHPLHTVPTAMLAITIIALIEREKGLSLLSPS